MPRDSSHKDIGEFSSERTEYAVGDPDSDAVGPDAARVAVALGEFDVGVQEQYALWRTTGELTGDAEWRAKNGGQPQREECESGGNGR